MKPENNQRTEEILNSLDGLTRASAPDFFYTRLKARMEKELVGTPGRELLKRPWILRPVFAFAALLVIILINAAVIFQGNNDNADPILETESYRSIAAEYRINENVIEEVYK